jgi:deltex
MPDGVMFTSVSHGPCDGFDSDTWSITYQINGGINNGKPFGGDSRKAYLPRTREGTQVLYLLQEAFRRRHTFTVGFSVTRKVDNLVVWNGIHHKTHRYGGSANFGFPDDTYFARVTDELKQKGIQFESDQ